MNQGENIISRLSAPQYDTRGMALLGQSFQSAMKSGSDLLNEYGKKQAENLANAKASELMAKGDIKSLQQASPLLAYASEPMQKQAQSLLGSLQADRAYGLQERASNLADSEFEYKKQHDADLINLNREQFNKKYGLDLDEFSFKKSQAAIQNGLSARELLLRENEAKRIADKDALNPYITSGQSEIPTYSINKKGEYEVSGKTPIVYGLTRDGRTMAINLLTGKPLGKDDVSPKSIDPIANNPKVQKYMNQPQK